MQNGLKVDSSPQLFMCLDAWNLQTASCYSPACSKPLSILIMFNNYPYPTPDRVHMVAESRMLRSTLSLKRSLLDDITRYGDPLAGGVVLCVSSASAIQHSKQHNNDTF